MHAVQIVQETKTINSSKTAEELKSNDSKRKSTQKKTQINSNNNKTEIYNIEYTHKFNENKI